MQEEFDVILMIAYGGPEKPEDIRPFLERVASGRSIPPDRLEEVAHHYELIGGRSPINELTFRQAKGLEDFLKKQGPELPVYVGMRNWHPFLSDTIRKMNENGLRRIIGIIMAAHQCDASWQRYQRDVEDAMREIGVNLDIRYTPPLFDQPLFIEACADLIAERFKEIPKDEQERAMLFFTAHSIPVPMVDESPYVEQLRTSARLIAERLNRKKWTLCYQSRSGRPTDPWLEPDISVVIRDLAKQGARYAVVQPIGFLCDHVEVLYDLDIEAVEVAEEAGIHLLRAETVNDHPKFIQALADVVERHLKD
ncbi:MAG: ferrochelatase [Thermodesulfobacteriota bacterium]